MADNDDEPRTWGQWSQAHWHCLLVGLLVVLAGLAAATIWYYRPPVDTLPVIRIPAGELTARDIKRAEWNPVRKDMFESLRRPSGTYVTPKGVYVKHPETGNVIWYHRDDYVPSEPQLVHSEELKDIMNARGHKYYIQEGLPHVLTSERQRYYASQFPQGWERHVPRGAGAHTMDT